MIKETELAVSMRKFYSKALDLRFFDAAYYERQAAQKFASQQEAFDHYDKIGWRRNLNPSALFDTRYYLNTYSDVRDERVNPLIHFLEYGRVESRRPRLGEGLLSAKPIAPADCQWDEIGSLDWSRSNADAPTDVDIIIPVYRGYDDTLACIFSVLTSKNNTPYRLIVIDDQSPDENLSRKLDELAEKHYIMLLRNEHNLGFVRTTNRGMELSTVRDVVLLNSDTIVYGDWLDRLRYHAKQSPRIATVTPFSNNATILSYPLYLGNNNTDLEIDFPTLDQIFNHANKQCASDIITGVGFCFYINRACIDQIGLFDAHLFGRGYGEENDFCRRAAKAGWANLAAWDIFVRHTGEVSFHDSAVESKRIGYSALLSIHPEYDTEVQCFIKNDPLSVARQRVDIERIKRLSCDQIILFIEHGRGGGTDRHIQDLVRELNNENVSAICGRPGHNDTIIFSGIGDLELPNLPKLPLSEIKTVTDFFSEIGVNFVHIHSLLDFDLKLIANVCAELNDIGVPYYYTIHDYAAVCPRITMTDWSGTYCNSKSLDYCNHCLSFSPTVSQGLSISEWRAIYSRFLMHAQKVLAPHADAIDRTRNYFSLENTTIRPHLANSKLIFSDAEKPNELTNGFRKIAVVGAIGPHKGSSLLLRIAGDALLRRLPIKYKIYGYSDRSELKQFPGVEITGRYIEDEIHGLLEFDTPDLILLPSIWPETHCYTLDVAFEAKITPIVFDIGAQAARVRDAGFGIVLPLELSMNPSKLNDTLLGIHSKSSKSISGEVFGRWFSCRHYYDFP